MTEALAPFTSLATQLTGTLVSPTDPEWDSARMAWNLAVDQRPDFVVQAATVDDVVATINAARAAGLRVTPQGTGHHAPACGDLAGSVLLRTSALRRVEVDLDRRRVRAEAGVVWDDVTREIAPHGLTGLVGSSGGVGIAGYLLGGGCSWLGREYGMACNSVTAVDVVTGDGEVLHVDAEHEPELFWAVRGGGGNVAVVTSIEFTVYPISTVYAGALLFPIDRAREVFSAYTGWAATAPETAGSCVRLLRLPPLPELPEPLRGRAFAGIDGVINLPADDAAALIAPLRALGPELDTFGEIPAAAIGQVHMDPPDPVPGCGDGLLIEDLPDAAVEALLAVAGPGVDSPLLAVDIRHLGGALGRGAGGGGAIDRLDGTFMVYAVGIAPVAPAAAAVQAALGEVRSALQPWAAPRDYLNFSESPAPADRFYPADVLTRLIEVQRRYDPSRVVRAAHCWTEG